MSIQSTKPTQSTACSTNKIDWIRVRSKKKEGTKKRKKKEKKKKGTVPEKKGTVPKKKGTVPKKEQLSSTPPT